jgi:hypothetical protein
VTVSMVMCNRHCHISGFEMIRFRIPVHTSSLLIVQFRSSLGQLCDINNVCTFQYHRGYSISWGPSIKYVYALDKEGI